MAFAAACARIAPVRVGLDRAAYAGHSLSAGFVTKCRRDRPTTFKIAEVSRHKSTDVLAGYVRRVDLFKDHAGSGLPVTVREYAPNRYQ
jgi:hypothetical protein